MKRKYLMLSMLISGPRQPGNDIDIYLAPLIEDQKMMWESSIEVFDAHRNENFKLKAIYLARLMIFQSMRIFRVTVSKGMRYALYVIKKRPQRG